MLFWPLICERLDNCLRIIGNDHSQAVFATGWANRIAKKLGCCRQTVLRQRESIGSIVIVRKGRRSKAKFAILKPAPAHQMSE